LLPKLFEVFVQGRQALDRAQGGLGLGLALVRKLVELQGGTVTAESPGVGQGSTFTIHMLCASGPAVAAQAPPVAPPRSLRLRILIVEDNPDAREMFRILLETEGHEVYEAASGPSALEQAHRVRPQVGLIDLGLPGFDGLELARQLRADDLTRGMTLVAVSGYGQSDDLRRTFDAGFDDHLVKPVAAEKLVAVLRRAMPRSAELATSAEA
jgi:CheY-like chemotaxis protein